MENPAYTGHPHMVIWEMMWFRDNNPPEGTIYKPLLTVPKAVHPVEDIRGSTSKRLDGRTIVLAVTGSIAAVECVHLARELARNGARVIATMTEAATRILHPDAMWFATGEPPILRLTGDVEHVR